MTIITINRNEWELAMPRIKHVRSQARKLNARSAGHAPISSVDLYSVFQAARWRCCCCHVQHELAARGLVVDHVERLDTGGAHRLDNLQVICLECWYKARLAERQARTVPAHYIVPAIRRRREESWTYGYSG